LCALFLLLLVGFLMDTLGSFACDVVAVEVASGVVEDLDAGALAVAFFLGAMSVVTMSL
jgi:hypothetical protein